MPFVPHIRMTAIGTLGLGAGVEQFQYGLNLIDRDGSAAFDSLLTPNNAFWADCAADVVAFHGRATTRISSLAILREVKFASIGADGKYTKDPVVVNVADTPGAMTVSTATPQNPQDALAITLHTARRGPRGKGRFYIPMPVLTNDTTTLLVDSTQALGVRDSAVQLLNDLNNAPGTDVLDIEVHVVSSFGHTNLVSGVSVGRVVDTIRSRRRQIPENRTAIAAVSDPGS